MSIAETRSQRRFGPIMALLLIYGSVSLVATFADIDFFETLVWTPLLWIGFLWTGLGQAAPNCALDRGWWLPLVPLAMWMIWAIFIQLFGVFSIPALLFHLQYDLEANNVAFTVARQSLVAILPFVLVAISWAWLARRDIVLQRIGRLSFLPFLLINPLTLSVGFYLTAAYSAPLLDLNREYVDASAAQPPQGKRKNLIRVVLESTERTLWNETAFGDVAAPLKRLERQGFSATQIEQVELTGWTLAGLVASGCGVPLFNLGVIHRNGFDQVGEFMPEAVCLGDVLNRDGYRQVFLKGAPIAFSGTDRFLASHGYDEASGFFELGGNPDAPENAWGLNDDQIFDEALRQIEELAREETPFHLTVLTVGGHGPAGFIAKSCNDRPDIMKHPAQSLQAFACTNALAEHFIERLREKGLLENTVVVVQNDHLAMRNDIYSDLGSHERRDTLVILDDGLAGRVSAAPASMMDVYPTMLEALGYTLPQHRAGLGTSLLSSAPTLASRLGVGSLNAAILTDSALRNRLWSLKPAS